MCSHSLFMPSATNVFNQDWRLMGKQLNLFKIFHKPSPLFKSYHSNPNIVLTSLANLVPRKNLGCVRGWHMNVIKMPLLCSIFSMWWTLDPDGGLLC